MLNQSSLRGKELPYVPLPEAASRAAFNSLIRFGFDHNAIVEEYSFSSKNTLVKVNALAFAHSSQRDLDDYASVTVFNAVNGHNDTALVSLLAESSAPFHLIHREDRFSFWASGVDTQNNKTRIQPIEIVPSIAYDQLEDVLNVYAVDLKPQHIVDVKQGRDVFKHFSEINPLQLSFWAEEIRSKPLVKCFEHAVNVLRNHPAQLSSDIITTIATQLLGMLILADTGMLGQEIRLNRPPLSELITKAHDTFRHYFDSPFLLKKYSDAVNQAYDTLKTIHYAGFVPDMLGDLYVAAYEQQVRKNLGNYDTPLYLTHHIWDAIPIEYLPPRERVIADVTCGWGSFLIAGYERLSNLSDSKEVPLEHCLYGNDYNGFFTRLAKLGLMHTTSQDNWRIDNEDVFQWEWLKDHQPNIIVGNPPFAGSRKKSVAGERDAEPDEQETISERKRVEKANKFLRYAIECLKPGGYLALVMPRSFTVAEAGPDTRKKLLEECDVLELWDLPTKVFQGATVRTTVVFAQKKPATESGKVLHTCVRTRTVQPATLTSFRDARTYTASALVVDQFPWHATVWKRQSGKDITHIIDYTTILSESTWQAIRGHCLELQQCAERTRGTAIGTARKRRDVPPKLVHWLPDARHIMPYPYVLDYTKARMIVYPDDCERPRLKYEHLFQGQKVLLQYVQTPGWGRRVKLAIERKGYYIAEHFWVVAPKNSLWLSYTLTHEILAAILGWDVSNAWIIEHMKSPDIPSHAIDTIPLPSELSKDDCDALTAAVLILEEEANAGRFESPAMKGAHHVIDTILKAAYHLDEDIFVRLRQVTEWDSKPKITLDVQPDRDKAHWFTSGIVDSVDAEKGTITLWLDGFDELQTVQIVPSMPGWMLRPSAAFLTKIPREYRKQRKINPSTCDWGFFRPQPYMYMGEEELLEGLSKRFASN